MRNAQTQLAEALTDNEVSIKMRAGINTRGLERCVFGEDGESSTIHVTFPSFAYYIIK